MSSPAQPPLGSQSRAAAFDADGLRIWSCVICRRRKVRCDRREPCANCVRNNHECHYPVTGRIPRRRALPAGHPKAAAASDKHSVLISRLRRLESIVTELGIQVEEGASKNGGRVDFQIPLQRRNSGEVLDSDKKEGDAAMVTSPKITPEAGPPISDNLDEGLEMPSDRDVSEEFGNLVVAKDGALHIGNRFWTVFCDEVDNIFRVVEEVEFESEELYFGGVRSANDQFATDTTVHNGFIFGPEISGFETGKFHPGPSDLTILWRSYIANVDPFIKILHIPTMDSIISKFAGNPPFFYPENEALVLAVSMASVASLSEEEMTSHFGKDKAQLFKEYRLSTEAALSRSDFLTKPTITLLQAFVIYLSILPHQGMYKLSRSLTPLLPRLATDLGLHRDGSHLSSISFFEAEMNRRLWWQICLLDSKYRDLRVPCASIQDSMFDTGMPANIEDTELENITSAAFSESSGVTNATLLISRCQIWRLGRTLDSYKDKTVQARLDLIRSTRNSIRGGYLHDATQSSALFGFISSMTSLFFAKIETVSLSQALRQFSAKATGQEHGHVEQIRHQLYDQSLKVIVETYALRTRPEWSHWRWQVGGKTPWQAISIVLHHICSTPWTTQSEDTFDKITTLIEVTEDTCNTEDGLKSRVHHLLGQARTYRDAQDHSKDMLAPTADMGWTQSSSATSIFDSSYLDDFDFTHWAPPDEFDIFPF